MDFSFKDFHVRFKFGKIFFWPRDWNFIPLMCILEILKLLPTLPHTISNCWCLMFFSNIFLHTKIALVGIPYNYIFHKLHELVAYEKNRKHKNPASKSKKSIIGFMTHPCAPPNNQIYHLKNYITKSNSENGRTEHFVLMTSSSPARTVECFQPKVHLRWNELKSPQTQIYFRRRFCNHSTIYQWDFAEFAAFCCILGNKPINYQRWSYLFFGRKKPENIFKR